MFFTYLLYLLSYLLFLCLGGKANKKCRKHLEGVKPLVEARELVIGGMSLPFLSFPFLPM